MAENIPMLKLAIRKLARNNYREKDLVSVNIILNCQKIVAEFFLLKSITLKLSTMVGEIFEINYSEMSKRTSKSSTMLGENFEMNYSEISKNASKLSTNLWRKSYIY